MMQRKTERGIVTLNSAMTMVRDLLARGCQEVLIDKHSVEKTYTVSYYEPPQEWEKKYQEWLAAMPITVTTKNAFEAGYKEALRKAITLVDEEKGRA